MSKKVNLQGEATKEANKGTHFQHSKVDSIFNLVRIEGKIRIVIGQNIVSQKSFKTFAQADKYIAEKPYEILINTAVLIVNTIKDEKNKIITPSEESSEANK